MSDEVKGISDDDISDVLLTVHGEDSCGCHRCARALLALAAEKAAEIVKNHADAAFWSADAAQYFSKVREYLGDDAMSKGLEVVAAEIRRVLGGKG